jgi:hypothetical protein
MELRALVDYGALTPIDPERASWMFTASWVVVARTASRLRRDFELDAYSLPWCCSMRSASMRSEAELRGVARAAGLVAAPIRASRRYQ